MHTCREEESTGKKNRYRAPGVERFNIETSWIEKGMGFFPGDYAEGGESDSTEEKRGYI